MANIHFNTIASIDEQRPPIAYQIIEGGSIDSDFGLIGEIFEFASNSWPFGKKKNRSEGIIFDTEKMTIQDLNHQKLMAISDINNLTIKYNTQDYNKNTGYTKPSHISFTYQGKEFTFYITNKKYKFKKLIQSLYQYKIPFKEYYNDSRTYYGFKSLKYKQIQKFKEDYPGFG